MAGFSSIGRAIGGIPGVGAIGRAARRLPGVGGIANTLGLPGGAAPGTGGLAGAAPGIANAVAASGLLPGFGQPKGSLAPRPTDPNLGIATGNASQTTANNPLGSPAPPGMAANTMSLAQQAALRQRQRASGANVASRVSPNAAAVVGRRTRPLSMLGY